MAVDQVWEVLKQEMKSIGFGAGHSDASWNRELSKALGINTVPSIVGVINGRVYHFRGEYTLKNLREFIRKLIPAKLIIQVDQSNFNTTLYDAIAENKVLAVFGSFSSQVTLRYQMPCYIMSNNIKCVYIKLEDPADIDFLNFLNKNYHIDMSESKQDKEDVLYFFKENPNLSTADNFDYKPTYSMRARELSFATILQSFEENKFLNLPRIMSHQHFHDLCTSWSQNNLDELTVQRNKVICVLIASDSSNKKPEFLFDENMKTKFIKKFNSDEYLKKNVQLGFIHYDVQTDFFKGLTRHIKVKQSEVDKDKSYFENKIIILKRLDQKYAQFSMYDLDNDDTNSFKLKVDKLRSHIKTLKKLEYKFAIPVIHDESTQDLLTLLVEYFENLWSYISERYFWEKMLGNSSYMMIIFCTVLFIWLMMMFSAEKSDPMTTHKPKRDSANRSNRGSNQTPYNKGKFNLFTSPESESTHYFEESYEQSPNSSYGYQNNSFNNQQNTSNNKQFSLEEMNRNNYDHFVKMLPNGLRTILLIVNNKDNEMLIQKFSKVCEKFSNKSYNLRFAYLSADNITSQKWLNEIMFQKYKSIGEENEIDISEDEYEDEIKANLNKLDYDRSIIALALNTQRKHFLIFNIDANNLLTTVDQNSRGVGFEDSNRFKNKFQIELNNWLDKLTEGLNMNDKYTVRKWPEFN